MKPRILLLTITSTLVLSACGGGGGSSGATSGPTPVQTSTLTIITATNANKAAANGYSAASLIGSSSSSVADVLTGASVGGTGISAVSPVLKLVRRAAAQGSTQLLTGVTISQPCSGGGSVAVDANLRNAQTISNGDTMTLTAKNCVEDGSNLNGALSITFSDVSGDIVNTSTGAATLDTRYTAFTIASGSDAATINGDMKIALKLTGVGSTALTISGTSLQTIQQKAGATVASVTLSAYSLTGTTNGATTTSAASFAMSGNTNSLGQFAYTVKNITPFVSTGTAMPGAGSLIVNGAGSSVTVTALNTSSVRLDFSAKGDGAITQTATLSWAEFLASL
jgi:hypothetical protein